MNPSENSFKREGPKRVRVVGRKVPDRDGWGGEARYNVKQIWYRDQWVDAEFERVPDHAVIAMEATGDYGWKSRWNGHPDIEWFQGTNS